MTNSASSVDAYQTTLEGLLQAVNQTLLMRPRPEPGADEFATQALLDAARPGQEERRNTIIALADDHLAAASQVERETLPSEGPLPPQAAALMGGYWLAATALIAALQDDPDEEPFSADDGHAARVTLSLTMPEARIVAAAGNDLTDLPRLTLEHILEHGEVSAVVAEIAELPRIRGGAPATTPTPDEAIGHIVDGLVEYVDAIASTTVARASGGMLSRHVAEFLSQTALAGVFDTARSHLSALRRRLFAMIGRAVEIARRYLTAQVVDGAWEQVDDWIYSKVLGLLSNAQARVARSLLGTATLSLECGEAMARYHGNPDDLRGRLPAVMADYDRWAKWGHYGSRALTLVPLALLGPFTIPMLSIAVVALVSYEYWTAADHLDRPTWVPFDAAPGVATVLGIPKGGFPAAIG